MTSQKGILYRDAFKMFAEKGGAAPAPIDWRRETRLEVVPMENHDSVKIDIVLYGQTVARLFPGGQVQVWAPHKTNTTKNRINDALNPIGWRLRTMAGNWLVFPQPDGTALDYFDGMILEARTI